MDLRPGWGDQEDMPPIEHPPVRTQVLGYLAWALIFLVPLYVAPWLFGWH